MADTPRSILGRPCPRQDASDLQVNRRRDSDDRLFWLVPAREAEHGDREGVVTVTHARVIEELAERAGVITGKWNKERKAVA
jgi:hypothetical protein